MMPKKSPNILLPLFVVGTIFFVLCPAAFAQEWGRWFNHFVGAAEPTSSGNEYLGVGSTVQPLAHGGSEPNWLSINMDSGYRNTNFYKSGHNTFLFQGDSRLELWMPTSQDSFSWGPYVRFAGLTSDHSEAWENAWLAVPGFGLQAYPFSSADFKRENQKAAEILGPLRLFGEYNRMDYWGSENIWRPDEQIRVGLDYWKQANVNNLNEPVWHEIWTGLIWQSANEFDKNYDTLVFGNAVRVGLREPKSEILSVLTPYLAMESSLTENSEYYWENRLLLGAGIRFAPPLDFLPREWRINRFVVYAEYLGAAAYYRDSAPSSVPDHDLRVGISLSIGEWYR